MRRLSSLTFALLTGTVAIGCGGKIDDSPRDSQDQDDHGEHGEHGGGSRVDESALLPFGIAKDAPVGLVGRAVLPAATFVEGPGSGALIGSNFSAQPVQGFSCLVDAKDGSFWALADNGYGADRELG